MTATEHTRERPGKVPADPHPSSRPVATLNAWELSARLDRGELTSAEIVAVLVARIEALDSDPTGLHAVVELAPDMEDVAARLDEERRAGRRRGPLHGIPVLVKDNIDTAEPLHTSAGSHIFGHGSPATDAPLVRALREAGAIVIGKTNLSEWANFRSRRSSSGWSALGGQTRNPHALDRSPGGSSSGSGAAVAARLAPLAIGTETDGSIICPAAACGAAGLKPTLGLVSRTGVVPIAASQDTAGPIARSARDLALLLSVLAHATDDGEDHMATSTVRPAGFAPSALANLPPPELRGLRVGVLRDNGYTGYHAPTDHAVEGALHALEDAGAHLIDSTGGLPSSSTWEEDEITVLLHEFRAGMEAYLARRAAAGNVREASTEGTSASIPRTLDDLLAHAHSEPRERLDLFDVDLISRAARTEGLESEAYRSALQRSKQATRERLDRLFAADSPDRVDVLALPAMHPSWPIDHILGDQSQGAGWSPAAVAGYPSATLPVGEFGGLPIGVLFIGPPWSEVRLLQLLQALEDILGPAVSSPEPRFVASSSILA